jgi:membrane fusion protein, multidrug efflux system
MVVGPFVRRFLFQFSRFALLLLVPLTATFVGLYLYARGGRYVETENAYVKANIIAVSSPIPGRVVEVAVKDNESVAAGTLLFRINPQPYEIAAERARARLDVVRTEVNSLRVEYRAAQLEAEETRERIQFLQRQLERQAKLKEYGMARADVYDEARLNLELARRRLASVQENANRVLANLGGDPKIAPEKHPRFAEAKTAIDEALMNLERTRIIAPAAGIVSNMKLRVGEFAEQGTPVFSLIENGQAWIEANYKETQLAYLRVGQVAEVVSDIYPDQRWPAVVSAIAPATGAEFAVLPPQNATGNWVKVVQRVPVMIQVEPGHTPLRVGMTVMVAVDTQRERGLPRGVQRLVDVGLLPSFLQPTHALAGEKK